MNFSHVEVISYGWFEQRCVFRNFEYGGDNQSTQKAGVRCHWRITAFFLSFFGLIKTIRTDTNKIIYLNKMSLNHWLNRHWNRIPAEAKTKTLPSIEQIVQYYKSCISIQNHDQKPSKTHHSGNSIINSSDKSYFEDFQVATNQIIYSEEPPISALNDDNGSINEKRNLENSNTKLFSPDEYLSSDEESDDQYLSCEEEFDDQYLSCEEESDEDYYDWDLLTEKTVRNDSRKGKLAKKWLYKLGPAAFPEIALPLQILKAGEKITEARNRYQSGDAAGAIKTVAPIVIGPIVAAYGGAPAALALTAYKTYSTAKLVLDTVDVLTENDRPEPNAHAEQTIQSQDPILQAFSSV